MLCINRPCLSQLSRPAVGERSPCGRWALALPSSGELRQAGKIWLDAKNSPKKAFIGQQFIDLEMADPDGKMHKISELVGEGHWVLVDFWASWCGPCRAEMPNVLEAYNQYHAKGFEVIGISFDENKDAWLKAVEKLIN